MFVTPGYAQEGAQTEGEVHGEAVTEQAEDHGANVFPPFDASTFASQLLWLAITFGLFYLFLQRVILPRMGNILESRQTRVQGDLERAAAMKSEADQAVAAYEQSLAEARGSANRIAQEARDNAKADAEAERRQVEAGLDARLGEAQARIEGIKASAMANVGGIAEEAAEAIVRQLTGKDVDPAAVRTAVASTRG